MNTDHDYQIGKDHEVCEDYALSGHSDNFAYAIVSDGCSAAKEVDFGARVVALAAREMLQRVKYNSDCNWDSFGTSVIRIADLTSCMFPSLDPEALDTTLLVTWVRDGIFTAYMYGDGVFFHKGKNGIRAIHVDINVPMGGTIKSAPDYLSYTLDSQRKNRYIQLDGKKEIVDTFINDDSKREVISSVPPFRPVIVSGVAEPGDIIAVSSDGINSFRRQDDTSIDWKEAAEQYMSFKNFAGYFVRRRLSAYLRQCRKDLTTHSDDVSMAAILV